MLPNIVAQIQYGLACVAQQNYSRLAYEDFDRDVERRQSNCEKHFVLPAKNLPMFATKNDILRGIFLTYLTLSLHAALMVS